VQVKVLEFSGVAVSVTVSVSTGVDVSVIVFSGVDVSVIVFSGVDVRVIVSSGVRVIVGVAVLSPGNAGPLFFEQLIENASTASAHNKTAKSFFMSFPPVFYPQPSSIPHARIFNSSIIPKKPVFTSAECACFCAAGFRLR
jgi:hypothetical protein